MWVSDRNVFLTIYVFNLHKSVIDRFQYGNNGSFELTRPVIYLQHVLGVGEMKILNKFYEIHLQTGVTNHAYYLPHFILILVSEVLNPRATLPKALTQTLVLHPFQKKLNILNRKSALLKDLCLIFRHPSS